MLALCMCGTWLQGILSVFDPPRIDTKATIEAAYANGVEVKMVTGDHTAIAVETCRMLGMGTKVRARHDVSSARTMQRTTLLIPARSPLLQILMDLAACPPVSDPEH